MLTRKQLEEIEKRYNAATKGPWVATSESCPEEEDDEPLLMPEEYAYIFGSGERPVVQTIQSADIGPDLVFCQHAREDLPEAVATIRELVSILCKAAGPYTEFSVCQDAARMLREFDGELNG